MSYMSYSQNTLNNLWKKVEEDFPVLPDIDYSSGYQKIEQIEIIEGTECKLVVFRGIVKNFKVEGNKYFKFYTKCGPTMMFDVNYLHYGVVEYDKDFPCEIIYRGGILRVTNLKEKK